jgi:hypothetical protein
MGTVEMQDLAKRLAKMRLWRAKWTAYGMDKQSHYDYWRVVVANDEYHTRLTLPNKGIRVIFVERKEDGQPNDNGLVKVKFKYLEARVEPIPPEPAAMTTPDYVSYV